MTFEFVAVAVALGILGLDAALGADTMLTGSFVAPPIIAAIGAGPRATARVLAISTVFALLSGILNNEFGTVDHLTRMLPVVLGGGLAVYVADLRSQREQTAMRLETQYGVARTFTEAGSLEEAVPRLLAAIGAPHGWELGGYWVVGTDGALSFLGSWHAEGVDWEAYDAASRDLTLPPGAGVPGKVLESEAPLWVPDLLARDDFRRAEIAERLGLRGFVGFPLKTHGKVIAVMEFLARSVREPEPDQLALFEALGSQIGGYVDSLRDRKSVV